MKFSSNFQILLLVALAVGYKASLGGGFGEIQQSILDGRQAGAARAANAKTATDLRISVEKLAQETPIANLRYKTCALVVLGKTRSPEGKSVSAAISLGAPVFQAETNLPLSVGALVCDTAGLTAEIVDSPKGPIAGNPARTNDPAVIAEARSRALKAGQQLNRAEQN